MYKLPSKDILHDYGDAGGKEQAHSDTIKDILSGYGVEVKDVNVTVSPNVTVYNVVPERGVRVRKIKRLDEDLAVNLAVHGIRVSPGKGSISIEVPNKKTSIVSMRSMIDAIQESDKELPIGFGRTINNETYVADLTKMPHLLMAGATGQGKSVGINTIISSFLFTKTPDQVKFILVDPKKVEMPMFAGIRDQYLARPIVTETDDAVKTLNTLCKEMGQRYDKLKEVKARNIKEYNAKGHTMPYIVCFVDEFADLMMEAGRDVELPITRLAQLARAVGIHLVIATQRPSVNVITGLIKANFPARVAFRVISGMDSRIILDRVGAEKLIGKGDMIISTGKEDVRLQCSFVDTPEIERVVSYIGQQPADRYNLEKEETVTIADILLSQDEMLSECKQTILETGIISSAMLQRKYKLSESRADKILKQLEIEGTIKKGQICYT